jgi:hypothetical protein
MLLQYSQTVWTLLGQRKTIFAPQLGQLATGCVIANGSPALLEELSRQSLATCLNFSS